MNRSRDAIETTFKDNNNPDARLLYNFKDSLKSNVSFKGSSEKKHLLDKSRENLLINEVENIWDQISLNDNWNVLEDKIQRLRALGNILDSEKIINF